MIKLSSVIKTYVSPVIDQPLNSGTSFTQHIFNHNFGVAPNSVRLLGTATATAPANGIQFPPGDNDSGVHTRGFNVASNSENSTTINVFRAFPYGDIYFVIQHDGIVAPT